MPIPFNNINKIRSPKLVSYQRLFKIVRENIPKKSIEDVAFVACNVFKEIQILATFMKCEWLNRVLLTWENVKPLYVERDFSQANLIDKYTKLLKEERANAKNLERLYYRSRKRKPFDYTKLAGE